MSATAIALQPGSSLQEYQIEQTLGVGGFGLTYLATDSNLNLKVAIKEYLPSDLAIRAEDQSVHPKSQDTTETFRWGLSRFLDESRTLASFRHPNIVRVMRFFQANHTAYMVMEFVKGSPLPDWLRTRRPLPEKAVRDIALPLLDGLDVIHAGGFLHRDIKPGNIFIREDGSPVLLDFGSARMIGGNSELTAIVSPGYAPLEQYHTQGRQGAWTDLYAVGGVLYWMVTGNKPVEAAARVRNDPMPAAKACGDASRYGTALLEAIDWALAPDESARPQSVAQMRERLGAAPAGPRAAGGDAEATVLAGAADGHPASAPSAGVFSREQLKAVEAELSKHIGPIAPVVLRSAAKKAATFHALIEAVAREIPDVAAREAFTKRQLAADKSSPASGRQAPSAPAASMPTQVPTQVATEMIRFDAATIAKAESAMAQYLGPLARVVVKRAAVKARDVSELYLLLADQIEDKEEKKAFIRKAISLK
jgi:hypothetical protein